MHASCAAYLEAAHDGLELLPVQLTDGTVVAVEDVERVRSTLDDVQVLESSKRPIVEVERCEGLSSVSIVSVEVLDLVGGGYDIGQAMQ
jgi:hypothetical protein